MLKKYLPQILLLLGFIVVGFINGSPFIFGDGYGYYHVAKTLVTQGDLVTKIAPDYLPYAGYAVSQYNGNYVTVYSAGPAILMWPFLTAARPFQGNATIYNDYYKAFNGHTLADGVAVLSAAIFYSYLSVLLIYYLLRNLNFSKKISIVSTAAVFLSSYALNYVFQDSSYSHTYELFALSLVLYSLIKFTKDHKVGYLFLAGVASGLLVLIRPIDIVIVLPIVVYVFMKKGEVLKLRERLKRFSYFIIGALPLALIFFYYNYVSYGSIIANAYSVLGGGGFSLLQFNLFKLLFSDVRGWFIWSPVMLVGFLGLIAYCWKNLNRVFLYLLPVVCLVITYSFWNNWWGGVSVGQRFFIVLVPFMAVGLAYIISIRYHLRLITRKLVLLFMVLSTVFSTSVLVLYRLTPVTQLHFEASANYPEVLVPESYNPFDMFYYNFNLASTSTNYLQDLKAGFNGGRSLLLLAWGQSDPLARIEKVSDNKFNLDIIPNSNNKKTLTTIDLTLINNINSTEFVNYEINDIDTSHFQSISFDCTLINQCIIGGNLKTTTWVSFINSGIIYLQVSDNLEVGLTLKDTKNVIKFIDYKFSN